MEIKISEVNISEVKISKIKDTLETADLADREELLSRLADDKRSGIKKLLIQYQKEKERRMEEEARMERMKEFEYKYASYSYICGIDEVGRGPLAGPVAAGAVILPKDVQILYLNDSKQLSAKMRDLLYDEIMEKAIAVGIGIVSPAVIDEINILQATYEAMRIAISKLTIVPDLLLNDAVTIPHVNIKQVGIVKGDARSLSIAAASVVAKVARDRMMEAYHILYPQYEFDHNKGYGSAAHIKVLKEIGPCPIHRDTFIHNFTKGDCP